MGERTGWRDPDLKNWHEEHGFPYPAVDDLPPISGRHRTWGPLYGCDIDWPFIEYRIECDHSILVSITDYKYREVLKTGNETDGRNHNNMALSVLSTPSGPLPFYITQYTKSPWMFRPIPMNDKARELAPDKPILTEQEYVEWLHGLREYQVNKYLISRLDNQISWSSLLPPSRQSRKCKSKKKNERSLYPLSLFDQNSILQQKLGEAVDL